MTSALHPGTRIIALDLHPQRYGYAVLETPADLLDWGVRRRYRSEKPRGEASLCRRLRSLLETWRPSVMVIKEPSKQGMVRMRKLVAGLLLEARRCRIPVHRFQEQAFRNAFSGADRITKYAIASTLLEHFPFLASALPPKRRIWESQDYQMHMFAAVALALAASSQLHATNR